MANTSGTTANLKRGASRGSKGNLNRTKNPWRNLIDKRALQKRDAWVLPYVRKYESMLLNQLGADATFAERRLINTAALASGCQLLVMHELEEGGVMRIDEDGVIDVQPALKTLESMINLELRLLSKLGIKEQPIAETVKGVDAMIIDMQARADG